MDGSEFDLWKGYDSDYPPYDFNDLTFYDEIGNSGIHFEDDKQYKFIHLEGTHYPYYINSNCELVEKDSVDALECARGVIKIVYRYLDSLKEIGAYDESSIIITADHGYYRNGLMQNPVLLIKPKYSSGKMKISMAPTSHANYAATILDLAGLDSSDYGVSNLQIDENVFSNRFFYQYYFSEQEANEDNYRLIEYQVDSENNRFENYHLTNREFTISGDIIDHDKYCITCTPEGFTPDTRDGYPSIVHKKSDNYPR